jgi:AraC family transcriptional regulator
MGVAIAQSANPDLDIAVTSVAASTEAGVVLAEFLTEAKAAIRRDPSSAERWFDRLEWVLTQTRRASLDEPSTRKTGGLAPWQATRVKRYIDEKLSERLNTPELAALVRLSENHFARAFKMSLGLPPHAYVVQRRIMRAKTLILETDLPLSQVALESGMADQAHLSRLFRRFFGATPSACRSQNRVPLMIAGPAEA